MFLMTSVISMILISKLLKPLSKFNVEFALRNIYQYTTRRKKLWNYQADITHNDCVRDT
jgi:hypothetical protein